MSFDKHLADRIRELVGDERGVSEKRMFGGLAFLVNGNMAVSASGQGGLLVRVDPARSDELTVDPRVRPFEMRGRPMTGWLHIDVDASVSDEELGPWVDQGVAMARSLPPR